MKRNLETRNQKSEGIGFRAVKSFEDLLVFQRAYSTSLEVHRVSLTLPKTEQFALANQMRRASKSICANIAEGFGRQRASSAEFRRFLTIAIGSCDEMQVWARYAFDLGYVAEETTHAWRREYAELARMLRSLAKSWA